MRCSNLLREISPNWAFRRIGVLRSLFLRVLFRVIVWYELTNRRYQAKVKQSTVRSTASQLSRAGDGDHDRLTAGGSTHTATAKTGGCADGITIDEDRERKQRNDGEIKVNAYKIGQVYQNTHLSKFII